MKSAIVLSWTILLTQIEFQVCNSYLFLNPLWTAKTKTLSLIIRIGYLFEEERMDAGQSQAITG